MYYVYEMQMPEEDLQLLKAIAAEEKISLNDLFIQVMRYIVDHPQEMKDWKERYDQLPEEERRRLEQIRISCVYPVEDGETEEEARNRMLRKAHEAYPFPYSPTTLPEISQQEFCDNIEDDDFFRTYGNPVVIRADSGTKLLAVAFPMYERYMRILGLGDEIDQIRWECAEAYAREQNGGEHYEDVFGEDDGVRTAEREGETNVPR